MLNRFIEWAKKENWNIIQNSVRNQIPEQIVKRYTIPYDWFNFISNFSSCSNQSDTKWFLTFYDFYLKKDGFQWNEFELQSLECAENDSELKKNIISYCDKHLPIFMSVDGEYSYYAINTENGNVVFGIEPEHEESDIIAPNFNYFIEKIISNEIKL